MIVCKNCGKVIFEGTKRCPACKAEIDYSEEKKDDVSLSEPSPKSRIKAGLFQIFFGYFGVGRFYTGHYEIAIMQIVLSLCFGIGYVWAIADGILILTRKLPYDAKHRVLK